MSKPITKAKENIQDLKKLKKTLSLNNLNFGNQQFKEDDPNLKDEIEFLIIV